MPNRFSLSVLSWHRVKPAPEHGRLDIGPGASPGGKFLFPVYILEPVTAMSRAIWDPALMDILKSVVVA